MSAATPIPIQKPFLRRLGKALAWIVVALLVVVGAWRGIRYAKLHLALGHAHREFAKNQLMRAEFWTGRALSVDPRNIDASRLMAQIFEEQDKPAALNWRIRVAQREPHSPDDVLAWAKCAFRFSQGDMTLSALKSLPPDFQDHSAEYHELMAGCALAAHQAGLAEVHFVKAVELGRDNPVNAVNLAAFRLSNGPSPETRAKATQELEAALDDPRTGLFATRALLTDAIRSHDRARAQKFAEKLRSIPEHKFTDELSCLEAKLGDTTFGQARTETEQHAAADPLKVVAAGDWLNAHGMAAETLRWFDDLPDPIAANIRVQMSEAEAYRAVHDWAGLEKFLAECHWEDGEYLRRAMQILCQREQAQPWQKEWDQLAATVKAHPPNGFLLAQLVSGWQWRKEALQLLWAAASQPRTNAAALRNLWDLYEQTGETRELMRVAKAQLELDPANPIAKNNEAFLSLLLFGASSRDEKLARDATTANPKVPEWASTYAFALHLAGKETEAKKVIDGLPAEALRRPGMALYSALVLAASGDQAQARETLRQLNPRGLLPEERKLAEDLAQQLNIASR